MDDRTLYYAMGDSRYFEEPWRSGACTTGPLVPGAADLPARWTRSTQGPWVAFRGPSLLPAAGWKVHVSTTPGRAEHVVGLVAETCFRLGVTWKSLASRGLVAVTQSKYAPRTASGKVCTLYPADETQLDVVLTGLRSTLAGEPGPRVVGDICDPASPVSVRWGAFGLAWTRAPDGTPTAAVTAADGSTVADVRIGGAVPDQRPVCVDELARCADAYDCANTLPVSQVSLVHRTNAGAIYTARHDDGRRVALKEARHHSGLAADGSDGVSRLRHEFDVLQRLSGHRIGPEPIAYLSCGGSDFLVMEVLDGQTLTNGVSTRHPATWTGATRATAAEFYAWVDAVDAEVGELLRRMHALGVVHRDLHPSNVVCLTGGALRLIDFECATLDGRQVTATGGAPGFMFEQDGEERDDLARRRLRLMMRHPVVSLLDRRPELLDELVEGGDADCARALGDLAPATGRSGPDPVRLVAGILAAATPARDDRLYPGSIEQFHTPGGAVGLLTGAAGVQLALVAQGVEVPASHRAWLESRPTSELTRQRGLAHGSDGIALALARTGLMDKATEVVAAVRAGHGLPVSGASWGYGHAGAAVALSELAGLMDDPGLLDAAATHLDATLVAVRSGAELHRPGFVHGFAGTALALLRLREAAWTRDLHARIDDGVAAAIDRELRVCRAADGYLLGMDRGRSMPYLGYGSAALGVAATRFAELHPGRGAEDIRDQVLRGLRKPMMMSAELVSGRAGILLALREIDASDPAVAIHTERLAWHLLPHDSVPEADEVLGEYNLRFSTDLATGSAGMLTALGAASAYRDILLLPSGAGASPDGSRELLTAVTATC